MVYAELVLAKCLLKCFRDGIKNYVFHAEKRAILHYLKI